MFFYILDSYLCMYICIYIHGRCIIDNIERIVVHGVLLNQAFPSATKLSNAVLFVPYALKG